MPLLVLLLIAFAAGACAAAIARFLQRRGAVTITERAQDAASAARRHPALRRALASRTDPGALTGLALTVALLVLVVGGLLVGGLAVLLHSNPTVLSLDARIASWAHDHATSWSTHGLNAVTNLGSTVVVITLAVLLAIVETVRTRTRWVVPFLLAVLVGEQLLSTTIKSVVDRARPTLNPIAHTLGPSFPSGHSTAAAAFYAAAALVLGRRAGASARALLAGAAVGIAVGVAVSRVMLDVHWVTDVVGGLALGWAWFAVCAIAFGGRLLRFGAPAQAAEAAGASNDAPRTGPGVDLAPNGYGRGADTPTHPTVRSS